MKVLMLGWEYPPHISGGLGTACEGLTLGLSRAAGKALDITFVVPKVFGDEQAGHMQLVDPSRKFFPLATAPDDLPLTDDMARAILDETDLGEPSQIPEQFKALSAGQRLQGILLQRAEAAAPTVRQRALTSLLSVYTRPQQYQEMIERIKKLRAAGVLNAKRSVGALTLAGVDQSSDGVESPAEFQQYGGDIFSQVDRYARRVVDTFAGEQFDFIHAHDWMTYPAGVMLSEITGKPLVVHVHSLERDRSGAGTNPRIDEIERWGIQRAKAVIAVSYYTKNQIVAAHAVAPEKISVVHNGVYNATTRSSYRRTARADSRIVLFLGRVTFQKGPEYFVEAAAKVIPAVPNVLFVMAGSGDMLSPMMRRVHELKIANNFFFPGFLRGHEVEQMFSLADLYVMPSVSEPFGISALEAISNDTPVIISKQSGVSEVLSHALKVDFWDVTKLADYIINALLSPELRADIVGMAREELKRLHWDAAAKKTLEIYHKVVR